MDERCGRVPNRSPVTCPRSDGKPTVAFNIGDGTSLVHHAILPGFHERLYLLEWNEGNVAIEVGPEGAPLDEYLIEAPDHRDPLVRRVSHGPTVGGIQMEKALPVDSCGTRSVTST